VQVEVNGPVSADSTAMLLGLAVQGAGILRLSEHVVAEAIQKGELEPLLQKVQDPEQYPMWALLPPGRNQAPKVKAFLDFLVDRLGSTPWRTRGRSKESAQSKRA
jgi:DNA-binding transcriptional LysR family regulator